MSEKAVLLAVAAAVGHPFSPFVVGDKGGDYEGDDEYSEEELHEFNCQGSGFSWMAEIDGFPSSATKLL
jgi:hypothetical protein